METRNSRTTFKNIVADVSKGSTDMMLVYRSQTEIRITKLIVNPTISLLISAGLPGGLLIRESAPIESASPNIKSERDSIRGLGLDCSIFWDNFMNLSMYLIGTFIQNDGVQMIKLLCVVGITVTLYDLYRISLLSFIT
ncbi:MAG: hypothetical protein WAW23_07475 [Candidatus Methanoperedens sp.]